MAENPEGAAKSRKVLAVLGPTGSGKSSFAIEIARAVPSEIISSDSMAVYRGIDIGTDKVPESKRGGVPHHLFDVAEPGSYFSAGLFCRMASEAMESIWSRARLPIVVGGTGLYARALLDGLSRAPSRDEALRDRLKRRISARGLPSLYRLLGRLDPRRAKEISARDELRIIRALEIRIITGMPFSEVMERGIDAGRGAMETLKLCLTLPRPQLYRNIEERVDLMIAGGLAEEARSLWESGRLKGPASKAIGYRELMPFFVGARSFDASVEEIKKNSRNLAKRQLTWFRKENGLEWVRMDDEHEKRCALEKVKKWYEGESDDR